MSDIDWWPGATPYLWIPAATTDGTDISGDQVYAALTLRGAAPQTGDWKPGTYDPAGPGGAAVRVQLGVDIPRPASGRYRPFRKIADSPETDVQAATNWVVVH